MKGLNTWTWLFFSESINVSRNSTTVAHVLFIDSSYFRSTWPHCNHTSISYILVYQVPITYYISRGRVSLVPPSVGIKQSTAISEKQLHLSHNYVRKQRFFTLIQAERYGINNTVLTSRCYHFHLLKVIFFSRESSDLDVSWKELAELSSRSFLANLAATIGAQFDFFRKLMTSKFATKLCTSVPDTENVGIFGQVLPFWSNPSPL